MRRLYNWVLLWSNNKYGPLALFILSFAEASFFPIPPDVLLVALCLGAPRKAIYFALICSLGSILGGASGYCIGHYLWWNEGSYTTFAELFYSNIPGFSKDLFVQIQSEYKMNGFLIIFTAGFTPIPYKIFTITAGAFNISFPLFIIATSISRSARFFLVSILIFKFGEIIHNFVDKYFNIVSIIITIILIGSYILSRYIFVI